MIKKIAFAMCGVLTASAVMAQDSAGMDMSGAGSMLTDASTQIKTFCTTYVMPALLVVIGIGLGIAIAFWGIRKLRSALNK